MQGVHKSSLQCLSTVWLRQIENVHTRNTLRGRKHWKLTLFPLNSSLEISPFLKKKTESSDICTELPRKKVTSLRLFKQYVQLWVIYKLMVPALPTENRKAFYLCPRYHFYSKEYKRMHQKVNTRVIKGCMKSMLYLYRTHHCLLANSFFSPLRIFPNHIKFIMARTDGTTMTNRYPKMCIWITCQDNKSTNQYEKCIRTNFQVRSQYISGFKKKVRIIKTGCLI